MEGWGNFTYIMSGRGMVEGNNLYMDSTRAEARGLLATMTRILSSIESFPKVQKIDHATDNEAVVDIYSGLKERSAADWLRATDTDIWHEIQQAKEKFARKGILYQVRWVRSHPEKRHTWLSEWNADDVLNSMADSLATLAIQEYVGTGNTQLIPARDSKRVWYAYTQEIGGNKMRITGKLRLMLNNHIKYRHYYTYLETSQASHINGQNLHKVIDQSLLRKMWKAPATCSKTTHMVRLIKTQAGILATETVLKRRNHGTSLNGNDVAICKLCEKVEETNLHMLCECTGNTEVVMERKAWILKMRKIVKDNLYKQMSPAQYEVMLGLWNVDELGKVNQWVTDDKLNSEAAENDQKLLQLRVLIDRQNGVDNHMYGITTTAWREFLEDALEITPALALTFQAELHKCTQHAIDKIWTARNKAKHGMTTHSELWELRTFEAAIQSWKSDAERKGKVIVEGSEARIRALPRKQKLKWVLNRLTNQKSIMEYWTKIPAIRVEEGLGTGLGGELELGRGGQQPPDLSLKVQIRVERRQERKQIQQSKIMNYFTPKDNVSTVTPTAIKRGSEKISDTGSEELNQQPNKKQALGGNGGSDTEELDMQIVEEHNQMEEERQTRVREIQLQVKVPGTMQGNPMLKRKGINNLQYSQTDGKKQSVEKNQPNAISVISGKDMERIEINKLKALEKLKSSKKRKEIEGQMAIEREKKRKQRVVNPMSETKKRRWSVEPNVFAQVGLSKRQKTNGQDGVAQLVCSTHKGIS